MDPSFQRYDKYLKEIISNRMNNDEVKKFIKNKLSRKIIISYDIQIYYVLKNIVKNMTSSRVVLINDPHFQIEYRIICIIHELRLISDKQKDKLIEIMKKTPINERVEVKPSQIINTQQQYLLKILSENQLQESKLKYDSVLISLHKFLDQVDYSGFGLNDEIKLIGYGSYINGFALQGSDLDSTISTDSFLNERALLSHIHTNFMKFQEQENFGFECHQILLMENLRVPVLTFLHKESNISIDLCVNNVLGVINSSMLKIYSEIDPRCQQLGQLVKIWAKQKQILSQTNFSSYSIILMRILPSLQKLSKNPTYLKVKKTVRHSEVEFFEARVDFETNMEFIQQSIEPNTESIDQLFKQFFKFYAQNGEFLNSKLRCSIKGDVPRVSKEDSDFLYSIIDPFEQNHNLGERVKKNRSVDILPYFDLAIQNFNQNNLEEIFTFIPYQNVQTYQDNQYQNNFLSDYMLQESQQQQQNCNF